MFYPASLNIDITTPSGSQLEQIKEDPYTLKSAINKFSNLSQKQSLKKFINDKELVTLIDRYNHKIKS